MSPEQGSQCVRPVVVEKADLLDSFDQGLELFLIAWEIALPGEKKVVDVLLAQAALLHSITA